METGLGLQTVLRNKISGTHPMSYAETPGGLLLLANGIDPMLRWDGTAGTADTAGVPAPATAMELGGVNLGKITGKLVAYQRFLDANGNVSDFSPVSNMVDMGRDGLIEDVDYAVSSGVVTVRSSSHGLTTGEAVIIDGVEGLTIVNGTRVITVVDADTFTLNMTPVTSGTYTQGGVWTLGIETIVYGAVPVPVDGKVARRQILRNLAGNAEAYYVDIDTDDLASTAFSSTRLDPDLSASEPVPLVYGDSDLPFANRHGLPPSHKSVLASHKGRMFAAVDAPYRVGHCEPAFNSTLVRGVGTTWTESMAGRTIYIDGAITGYLISSVAPDTQVITLDSPFLEATRPYALYAILPERGERKLVYYSEPGLPESWPVWNAIGVPEDVDSLTALVTLEQFLYVVERRHIYRITFDSDPAVDGYLFLSANRGSLSNRTYAVVENAVYFLDEIGIHKFDGQSAESVSGPIQTVFQQDETSDVAVDWTADQSLWHAAHDPVRDTIRWFVTMVGADAPYHAICYNYRTDRWWIEQYPTPMTCSCSATIGHRRSLAGTDARRVVCLAEGNYDGVSGEGTLRGSPSSADETSLTDSSADFWACEGAPISIVDGAGRGQNRIVASATATAITVTEPWEVIPDATSVYQIGGIAWVWQSGWFRYFEDESENNRDVDVVFRPTANDGLMNVQLYFDHAADPREWFRNIEQDGVRTEEGSPLITIDLKTGTGWARQRMSGHADPNSYSDRFVSVELSGVQAGAPVRVAQVILNGVVSE